jgi:acetyltransferase AlgX (SGNH hydrolase-like protein)
MNDLTPQSSKYRLATRYLRKVGALHAERNLAFAFLGCLTLALVLPLLQTLYPIFGAVVTPLEERRTASPFPSPLLLLGTTGEFATALNNWFDDRVGFRDLFIRTKNQIDYTFFGTSKKVYIGSNGWLFLRGEGHPIAQLDDDGLSALEESYTTLANRLREKGIRLIVVGYPSKSAIYPEMAPIELRAAAHSDNYDKFRRFLGNRTDLQFIDVEPLLRQEEKETDEHLYYQTDMHVTPIADIPVVKELVATIARDESRPDIRWDENFTLQHGTWKTGGDARFLSVLSSPKERIPDLTGTYRIGAAEADGNWFLPEPHILERADDGKGRPFDWEFRSLPELCSQRLPGMVLFGNSFSDMWWYVGLHRYFCFIRRARNPISRLKLFFDDIPPGTKYFIFQYYEPGVVTDAPTLNAPALN